MSEAHITSPRQLGKALLTCNSPAGLMNLHIMFGLTAAAAALLPLAAGADNITELALAIGGSKSVACPTGMSLIEAAANWDNDFNSDAGGDFVYLCAGTGGTKPPITALSAAATASAKSSGACPAGYEQLPGNMNQGSTKDTGFLYLCASRDRNAGPALSRIVGEPTDACPGKLSAVSGTGGAPATPFNFDAAGQGVVLCTGHSVLIKPATTLALAIGASSVACPAGTSRIEAGAGWDADFNSGSGGKYVYLCVGRGGSNGPITAITAVTSATAKLSGACPVGYEQLAGNANDGSKNTGFLYVCVSRGAGTAITRLIGEAASTACPRGMSAVRSASAPFNFDPAGSNVFLCTGQAPKPCPPGPSPGPAAGPVTALSLMIGTSSDSQICCPAGWQRITDGDDSPSPQTRWDGNFNSGAGGDTVVLCAAGCDKTRPLRLSDSPLRLDSADADSPG